MKNILVISPQKSYPATDGGKIGILFPLLAFRREYNVHHFFISNKQLNLQEETFFKNNNITIFPFIKNTEDKATDLVKNIFEVVPFKMKKFLCEGMVKQLCAIVEKYKIDLVWINHAHIGSLGIALKDKYNLPVYLREHNLEYEIVRQYAVFGKSILHRLIAKWQYYKSRTYETAMWDKYDKVFFISDHDYQVAKSIMGNPGKAEVVYDSFGTVAPTENIQKEEKSFVFSGSLKTFQNLVNLETFLQEIMLPLVQKDPDWKLYVTANKTLRIKNPINTNTVINAGFVDDINQYTSSKKYFISPTIMGSGVRIKILNAMALGMVCFISALDYESMDYFKDMQNVVKYADFDEFYRKLLHLENNEAEYNKISANALKVQQDLTWEKYVQRVIDSIDRT